MLGSLGRPCHSAVPYSLHIGSPYYYYAVKRLNAVRAHDGPTVRLYLVPYACSSGPVTRLERNAGDDTSRYRARPGLPPTNAHCAAARACYACGSTFHVVTGFYRVTVASGGCQRLCQQPDTLDARDDALEDRGSRALGVIG